MSKTSTSNALGYWVGVTLNNNFKEGQDAWVFYPGIGERVNQKEGAAPKEGTQAAAATASRWIASMGNLPAAADLKKFNIVAVPPRFNYEFGEHAFGATFARDALSAGKVIALTNSLGQFGFSRQASKDPSLPAKFDALIGFVTGNGMSANTAKNIAAAKLPCWFFTAENDTKTGTTPQATINLHKAIIAAGGVSWLTVFKAGQYEDDDAHQIISVVLPMLYDGKGKKIGDPGALTTATPLGEKGIKNVVTNPVMSIYDWARLNSRVRAHAPDEAIEVKPAPIPEPAEEVKPIPKPEEPEIKPVPQPQPAPVKPEPQPAEPSKPSTITNVLTNARKIKMPGGDSVNNVGTITWSDGSITVHEANEGDRCRGVQVVKDGSNLTVVMGFEYEDQRVIGPYK